MLHTKQWCAINIYGVELTWRGSHVIGRICLSGALIDEFYNRKVLPGAMAHKEQQEYGEEELSNALSHHTFG